jgi:hypothetical protein
MNKIARPTLPPQLVFSKPPFRIEESNWQSPALDSAATQYLRQILDWRATVLEFVRRPEAADDRAIEGFSDRARLALETFLSSSWPEEMTRYAANSPYSLACFPDAVPTEAPASAWQIVRDALRWRAGIVDYLSDVWDVMGEPSLDMDECTAIGLFLRCAFREPICHLCLTEFSNELLHPDAHRCVLLRHVRAKWRVIPIFERWKDQASPSSEGGSVD